MQRRWLVISGSLEAYAAASKQELSAVIGDETDGKSGYWITFVLLLIRP